MWPSIVKLWGKIAIYKNNLRCDQVKIKLRTGWIKPENKQKYMTLNENQQQHKHWISGGIKPEM